MKWAITVLALLQIPFVIVALGFVGAGAAGKKSVGDILILTGLIWLSLAAFALYRLHTIGIAGPIEALAIAITFLPSLIILPAFFKG